MPDFYFNAGNLKTTNTNFFLLKNQGNFFFGSKPENCHEALLRRSIHLLVH